MATKRPAPAAVWAFYRDYERLGPCRTEFYWEHNRVTRRPVHTCPRCGEGVGMLRSLPPHRVECDGGGDRLADYVPVSCIDAIVSEQLFCVLRSERITGWRPLGKVTIIGGRPKRAIQRDGGRRYIGIEPFTPVRVNERASEFARNPDSVCGFCGQGLAGYKRVVFERPVPLNTPDLFWCWNMPSAVFCSQRFRDAWESRGFVGMAFCDPARYRWWERESFLGGELMMGKICDAATFWMRRRAAELRGKAGIAALTSRSAKRKPGARGRAKPRSGSA